MFSTNNNYIYKCYREKIVHSAFYTILFGNNNFFKQKQYRSMTKQTHYIYCCVWVLPILPKTFLMLHLHLNSATKNISIYFVDLFHQTPKIFRKTTITTATFTIAITTTTTLPNNNNLLLYLYYLYRIHLYKTHHTTGFSASGDKLMFLVPISNIYRHPLKYCLCIHTCKEIS